MLRICKECLNQLIYLIKIYLTEIYQM
ncbi:hypothetical protein XFF6991_4921 [Xanthomonas phaseoli pv. phaseoli]|uniref:Uncharacterized protein n=1 Tax=Xanthomonas campestris pv. phaseoli TaxID=317013 RepID=A0A7Z7IXN7_XANCH|nr:hypothetical protein XFF6991_4921 [Xanthomonas phaseoli pv. phaseoli]